MTSLLLLFSSWIGADSTMLAALERTSNGDSKPEGAWVDFSGVEFSEDEVEGVAAGEGE